jgi:glycosyltransferase involved in cell wall biosynthesis
MKQLCLNMIVRNEAANIGRCLAAVSDHIACWVIGDTGSGDGTQDIIRSYFASRGIPGELHSFPFHNFEQARNAALEAAYASPLPFDYLLFCDADMELVVEDPDFRKDLAAPSYLMLQRGGSLVYWNTRLADRQVAARYHGLTHEYLAIPGRREKLSGAWFIDHASGSNRVDKFERDIRLLNEALAHDPSSARDCFYLAQSYRDAGRIAEAAATYARRAEMGGWDEEAWYARLQHARCLRSLGDEPGFLQAALTAFNQRPWRAEPLYDLAKYYRERGMHEASLVFSEAGIAIPQSDDTLFIDGFIHSVGLKEEYAIAAYYARDTARKARGHALCDWLALTPTAPDASRHLARHNLYFYTVPLRAETASAPALPHGPRQALDLSSLPVATDTFDPEALSVAFDRGLLTLIREHEQRSDGCFSWHRFVWYDSLGLFSRISRRFYFSEKGREEAVALTARDKHVEIGFIGGDGGTHIASLTRNEIDAMLGRSPNAPAQG